MKKLITICLFMATMCTVNAQTKEETISWLQEKLEKSLEFGLYPSYRYFIKNNEMDALNDSYSTIPIPKIKSVKINECELKIDVLIPSDQWSKDQFSTITVILPTVIREREIYENRVFQYDDLEVYYIFNQKKYKFNSQNLIIRQQEENLSQRVKKALLHLNTFCPKKKETF